MPFEDGWPDVWASVDDERLENTLFDYLWLAASVPNTHANRAGQLKNEADRRGKPEMIERAGDRVQRMIHFSLRRQFGDERAIVLRR